MDNMIDKSKIKLVVFDLDGTLTQHRSPMCEENRRTLDELGKRYKLLMSGAGRCLRIFNQMEKYPIDIIGNYGMQFGKYNAETGELDIVRDDRLPCDRESVSARVSALREKYGYTEFAGDGVEFHDSGCVTWPVLGTKAKIEDKLAFDPDRSKRRAIYAEVCEVFSDYIVFVGGSSSFDMSPAPYNKAYALAKYCEENGLTHDEVVFVGDDYGEGGNDESVYKSDFHFIKVDDYREFPQAVRELL